jgi:hypothetical protein
MYGVQYVALCNVHVAAAAAAAAVLRIVDEDAQRRKSAKPDGPNHLPDGKGA